MAAPSAVAQHGERKLAVLMFADLTGYTELCRRLDPEDVVATVRPVMAALQRAATDAGGVICSTAGDGFMAVFGVPVAVEDAAERAMSAAEAMQAVVRETNARPGVAPIPEVHIGIAAGEVFVAPSDEPLGWALVGSAVNLASRLCDIAGPSQTLVDDHVRELVGAAGEWGVADTVAIRGHDVPVRVWPLLATTPSHSERSVALPFVDRAETLTELDHALSAATAEPRTTLVQLDGEAGIGKTRLAEEWLSTLDLSQPAIWLRCSSPGTEDHLVQLLSSLAELTPEEDFEQRLHQIRSSSNVEATIRTDPFPALIAMLRQLLEATTATHELAVVVDDLHAADPTLVAALGDVSVDRPGAPVLFLLTCRSGEAVSITADVSLHLSELPQSDTETLLAAALGAPLAPNLRDIVLPRIQGHPLMTVQSAAYLRESGTVEVTAGRSEISDHSQVQTLPTSLRLFVAARIDQLPVAEKAVLQELSCCGEEISADELSMMGLHGSDVVTALERRSLLRRTTSGWRFGHGLVREVAYSSLPRGVRSRLHRDHLGALPTDANTARRLFHAAAWADAAAATDEDESRRAATAAIREGLDHARELFRLQADAAHAIVRRLQPLIQDRTANAPDDCAELLTLGAHCLIEMWRFDDALHLAAQAVEICRQHATKPATQVRAMLANGAALSRLRRYHAARQVLDEAYELALTNGDDAARASALYLLAGTWRVESWSSFIALTEEAHNVFRDSGDVEGAGTCARVLYYLLSYSPTSRLARWYQTAREATKIDDVRGMAWLRRADAMAAACRLELGRAKTAAEGAVELGRIVGALDIVADGLSVLTEVAGATGDHEGAREHLDELRNLAGRTGNPRTRLIAANCSALSLLRAGALDECREEMELAREAAAKYGPSEQFDVDTTCALVARDRGDWPTALSALAAAREAAEQGPFAVWALGLAAQQARVLVAGGQPVSPAALASLAADCRDAGAAVIADYVDAVAGQLETSPRPMADAGRVPAFHPEIRAIHAENQALLAERTGGDSRAAWREAADAWQPLGHTIWLARARMRAGDIDVAEETLTAIGADDSARDWVRQG